MTMESDEAEEEEDEERRNNNTKRDFEALEITSTFASVCAASLSAVALSQEVLNSEDSEDSDNFDLRKLPRRQRIDYDHGRVTKQLYDDWLGPTPRFDDDKFKLIFRILKDRYLRIREDVVNAKIPFYIPKRDAVGRRGACLDARLLLPLKVLAYGVVANAFFDQFQMSDTFMRHCLLQFDRMMDKLYREEYLRLPTPEDLKNINNLHHHVHGKEGMFGSLDCMHVYWNKCPMAWQGSYKGAKGKPTVVLEAISDYNLWFWHASFGFCGSLNDKTIFDLSPFLERLVDGTFSSKEKEAGLIPFKISSREFNQLYILVDGIYPPFSRFVRGMNVPIYTAEKKFTKWQESTRKDIERAFGVLQGKFQYIARPIEDHGLEQIGKRVKTCLILHNMCVADRIMGGVHARYNPAARFSTEEASSVEVPSDRERVQGGPLDPKERSYIGLRKETRQEQELITKRVQWRLLADPVQHVRLHEALLNTFK
jgi:Plant transposon protein